ncbi:MAG TPA: CoA-binding protein [Chloroflexota bacterium]|nr:CoA-binding protein [Chloroflexota bacterium]
MTTELSLPYQNPETIRAILRYARTVAIVGLSSNPLRASHFVGFYLRLHGYKVIAVNPRERQVFSEPAYASLSEVPVPIDVVDVFRAPSFVPAIADEAIAVGSRALWLQFTVISSDGAARASRAGLDVVMDRCMKVEHARYLGRMHWLGLNTGVISSRRSATE